MHDLKPETLGSYLDGELPVEQMQTAHDHIAGCPQCAAELANLVGLKRSLRSLHGQFTPTPEFRRRVRQQIAPQRSRWNIFHLLPYLATAGAMAVLLLLVLTTWMARSRGSDSLVEAADLHVGALASSHPLDVVSSDHHTVKPWFQGKIPFTFNIPDLTGTDFSLLGGRLVYLEQQPGAQLILALRKHEISVLIFRAEGGAQMRLPRTDTFFKKDGFNVESWQSGGLRFIVVSDADAAALAQLGRALQKVN